MTEPLERRTHERRKSSRLYLVIGTLFVAYAASIFIPGLHASVWVRFGLVCAIVLLCLLDRRGLTLKHFGVITALCGAGSAFLLAAAWHTQQAILWGVLTFVLAVFSIALFSIKHDPRVR